jgi:predicted GIY-YIG superfamily endonuclease
MVAEQLCFFRFSRPLEERFGKSFFRTIPKQPGIYVFRGARDKVLYVGQSRNLRQRLAYYKNAQPERVPRKIIRLVHKTETIAYELCATPELAYLRENELIQLHRPTFNVVNARSITYSYFLLDDTEADNLHLSLAFQPIAEKGKLYGAFKNRGLCRKVLFALGRWLWMLSSPVLNVFNFPLYLNHSRANELHLPVRSAPEIPKMIDCYFSGTSSELLSYFHGKLLQIEERHLKTYLEHDFLILTQFFELNAARNQALRKEFLLPDIIQKEDLDQFRLRSSLRQRGHSEFPYPITEINSKP